MKIEPDDLGYKLFYAESGRYEYVKFVEDCKNFYYGLVIVQDGLDNIGWIATCNHCDSSFFDEQQKTFVTEVPKDQDTVAKIDSWMSQFVEKKKWTGHFH